MKQEFEKFFRNSDICQTFDNVIHAHTIELHPVSNLWPFYMWGIDIVESLPKATRQRKLILVPIDYFTKCEEDEPYAQIKASHLT